MKVALHSILSFGENKVVITIFLKAPTDDNRSGLGSLQ